eukprot:TRINITY_DN5079_c0_g2_i1.p1 TRINITY_DN5079_c0_g2~~TRINITY_DN5079_c0_g2_i1.p1  ORF type:complete len:1716 (-),score=151.81 TRINITY_DN5079_c0_g2_i1:168-5315(-)
MLRMILVALAIFSPIVLASSADEQAYDVQQFIPQEFLDDVPLQAHGFAWKLTEYIKDHRFGVYSRSDGSYPVGILNVKIDPDEYASMRKACVLVPENSYDLPRDYHFQTDVFCRSSRGEVSPPKIEIQQGADSDEYARLVVTVFLSFEIPVSISAWTKWWFPCLPFSFIPCYPVTSTDCDGNEVFFIKFSVRASAPTALLRGDDGAPPSYKVGDVSIDFLSGEEVIVPPCLQNTWMVGIWQFFSGSTLEGYIRDSLKDQTQDFLNEKFATILKPESTNVDIMTNVSARYNLWTLNVQPTTNEKPGRLLAYYGITFLATNSRGVSKEFSKHNYDALDEQWERRMHNNVLLGGLRLHSSTLTAYFQALQYAGYLQFLKSEDSPPDAHLTTDIDVLEPVVDVSVAENGLELVTKNAAMNLTCKNRQSSLLPDETLFGVDFNDVHQVLNVTNWQDGANTGLAMQLGHAHVGSVNMSSFVSPVFFGDDSQLKALAEKDFNSFGTPKMNAILGAHPLAICDLSAGSTCSLVLPFLPNPSLDVKPQTSSPDHIALSWKCSCSGVGGTYEPCWGNLCYEDVAAKVSRPADFRVVTDKTAAATSSVSGLKSRVPRKLQAWAETPARDLAVRSTEVDGPSIYSVSAATYGPSKASEPSQHPPWSITVAMYRGPRCSFSEEGDSLTLRLNASIGQCIEGFGPTSHLLRMNEDGSFRLSDCDEGCADCHDTSVSAHGEECGLLGRDGQMSFRVYNLTSQSKLCYAGNAERATHSHVLVRQDSSFSTHAIIMGEQPIDCYDSYSCSETRSATSGEFDLHLFCKNATGACLSSRKHMTAAKLPFFAPIDVPAEEGSKRIIVIVTSSDLSPEYGPCIAPPSPWLLYVKVLVGAVALIIASLLSWRFRKTLGFASCCRRFQTCAGACLASCRTCITSACCRIGGCLRELHRTICIGCLFPMVNAATQTCSALLKLTVMNPLRDQLGKALALCFVCSLMCGIAWWVFNPYRIIMASLEAQLGLDFNKLDGGRVANLVALSAKMGTVVLLVPATALLLCLVMRAIAIVDNHHSPPRFPDWQRKNTKLFAMSMLELPGAAIAGLALTFWQAQFSEMWKEAQGSSDWLDAAFSNAASIATAYSLFCVKALLAWIGPFMIVEHIQPTVFFITWTWCITLKRGRERQATYLLRPSVMVNLIVHGVVQGVLALVYYRAAYADAWLVFAVFGSIFANCVAFVVFKQSNVLASDSGRGATGVLLGLQFSLLAVEVYQLCLDQAMAPFLMVCAVMTCIQVWSGASALVDMTIKEVLAASGDGVLESAHCAPCGREWRSETPHGLSCDTCGCPLTPGPLPVQQNICSKAAGWLIERKSASDPENYGHRIFGRKVCLLVGTSTFAISAYQNWNHILTHTPWNDVSAMVSGWLGSTSVTIPEKPNAILVPLVEEFGNYRMYVFYCIIAGLACLLLAALTEFVGECFGPEAEKRRLKISRFLACCSVVPIGGSIVVETWPNYVKLLDWNKYFIVCGVGWAARMTTTMQAAFGAAAVAGTGANFIAPLVCIPWTLGRIAFFLASDVKHLHGHAKLHLDHAVRALSWVTLSGIARLTILPATICYIVAPTMDVILLYAFLTIVPTVVLMVALRLRSASACALSVIYLIWGWILFLAPIIGMVSLGTGWTITEVIRSIWDDLMSKDKWALTIAEFFLSDVIISDLVFMSLADTPDDDCESAATELPGR